MSCNTRAVFSTVLLASTAAAAFAQSASGPTAAAASAPKSVAPAAAYRSAFEGYRRFSDEPVRPWRESNDLVGRLGGWQAYAREGQGGPEAGSASAGAAAHQGHAPGSDGMKAGPDMQMPPSVSGQPAPLAPAASTPREPPKPSATGAASRPAAAGHSNHSKP